MTPINSQMYMTKPKQVQKKLSENTGKTFSVIMPPFTSRGGGIITHHYIKGHISVFGRGFICFCCLEPNFLHGVSYPYSPEYWRVSSVIPQKNWGVWTHFLIFDPFYWLEKQPACDKSCIETAFECSFSFWNPFNLSAYGLFLHDMSEEHIVPKLA